MQIKNIFILFLFISTITINVWGRDIPPSKANPTQNDIPLDILNNLFNLIVDLKIKEDLEKVDNYLNKEEGEEEINTSTTVGGEE
uniref:Secreted protein n=1 Tax=Meloidogyne floridensis TaxID=298350 RepID=A0A915P463_9BILA